MRGTYTNASSGTCCTPKHSARAMLQTGREAPSRTYMAGRLIQTAKQAAQASIAQMQYDVDNARRAKPHARHMSYTNVNTSRAQMQCCRQDERRPAAHARHIY